MKRTPSHLIARYNESNAPAAIRQLADDLRADRAGAWERYTALPLRDQRMTVAALVDMGCLLGHGGVVDRCNEVAMARTRAGEDDSTYGEAYTRDAETRAAIGIASSRQNRGRAGRRRRRARLSLLAGLP